MSTKAATATTTDAGEQSGNLTLAELGKRMNKGRKAASTPATAPAAEAKPGSATSSEQADADAGTDLSQSAEQNSTALAAEAAAAAETEAETEAAETGATDDEATPETETDGETEAEAGAEQKPAKPLRDLQKRVGKLTEQRDEARAELNELRAKTAELEERMTASQPKATEHPGDAGFTADRAVREIDQRLTGVEAFLAWADENETGGTYVEAGKSYELSADDVKSYRRTCEKEARNLTARREARLETLRGDFDARRAAAHAEAARLYPWIEKKSSPEFQEALALIRANPAVLELPDFELVIARQVAGQRLEREAKKKLPNGAPANPNARPKGSTTPPKVVTHSPAAAPRVNPKDAEASAVEKEFQQSGRVTDLSKLLAQRRQARIASAGT